MPCYNAARYLREALDSVFSQTYKDFELIAIDDGSTDESLQILDEYRDRVLILQQENLGAGSARNYGISKAKGDYLAFLDADDIWFPWTLKHMADAVQKTGALTVLGDVVRFNQDELPDPSKYDSEIATMVYKNPLEAARIGGHWLYLQGALCLQRKAVIDAGGYASGRINGEDTHLMLKLGTLEVCVNISQPPLLAYRQHSSNSIHSVERAFAGITYRLQQEKSGAYPGNGWARLTRWIIITKHSRAISIGLLRAHWWKEAWFIYFSTLIYNCCLGRFKYLIGFPFVYLFSIIKKRLKFT